MPLNAKDKGLLQAVFDNNLAQALTFITQKANVNVRIPTDDSNESWNEWDQYTPLHIAAFYGYKNMAILLLENGAYKYAKAPFKGKNFTPADIAKYYEYHELPKIIENFEPPLHPARSITNQIRQNLLNVIGLEKCVATASGLMAAGTYAFSFSLAMLMADKSDTNAYKLAAVGTILVALGVTLAGHELGKVVKSTGYRLHSFFSHIETNVNRVSKSIVQTNDALQLTTETTNQAITRLQRTVDESIVVLKDESQKTFVELRGRGRDVAEAIQQGINQNKFKPEAHVNANVFAAVPIGCNII